jgi:glycosyltransferase involved in cell wall biosynthesis
MWARRRHVPRVLTVHTILRSPFKWHDRLMAVVDYTLVRPFVRIGDPYVVAVDVFVQEYVAQRYGIRGDHLVDIPVGIEADRFLTTDGRAIREKLGIGDRPMVLSVGHVIPLRDRLALVEAMPNLLREVPDLAVVVVGKIYDDRFLQRARELRVDHALIAVGEVPKDEVPQYAAAADVEGHDLQGIGFGTASLEMLAAGVPVVSVVRADNYPTAHFVDGEHLVLAESADPDVLAPAILRLINDPDLGKQIAVGGRRLIVDEFTVEMVAARYVELYEHAIEAGRARRES